MRDGLVLSITSDIDLTHRKALADLQEPRLRREVACGGLAQKIYVQINCDSQRNGSNGGKHGDVHGKIGERHHGCAGNGAPWTQRACAECLPDAAAALPNGLDRKTALGVAGLGKLSGEESLEFLARHQYRHLPFPIYC